MADYNEPYLTVNLEGISYDTPAYELPLEVWSNGKNIRFIDGTTRKFSGHSAVFGTLLSSPWWMVPVGYASDYYWVYADDTKVCVTDMTSHYDITPSGGLASGIDLDQSWNGCVINNLVVLNSSQEAPLWWTGSPSSPVSPLPGWPSGYLAKVIRSYKNFLIALDIYDGTGSFPDAVLWSAQAAAGYVPSSWDITDPTIAAGQYELSDTPGGNLDGLPLGDMFIVYKQRSCYAMQYIGGQYIFSFRQLFPDVGVMATGCVASIPGKGHLVLTTDDVVLHNGSTYNSILSGRFKRWFFSALNSEYYRRCFVVVNQRFDEAWVCIPTGGSEAANLALVWNYETNVIGFRDLPGARFACQGIIDPAAESSAWDDDTGTWNSDVTTWDEEQFSAVSRGLLLAGNTTNKFYAVDTGETADGLAFTASVTRESMPLLDRRNFKYLKGVYPRVSSLSGGTLRFRIGTQEQATDAIEWGEYRDFQLNEDDSIDCDVKARYFSLHIESTTAIDWCLHSIDFDIEMAERF